MSFYREQKAHTRLSTLPSTGQVFFFIDIEYY